jgi:2-polyprenyl-6-methoxyphenol hydroxylase-like FAD-dependent oxidoreductase
LLIIPIATSGGLGLTGGIADVGSLFDCLHGIHKGLADDSILDKYADIRRKIYEEVINPSSRENFKRLHDQDADTAGQNDPLFQLCHKAETDKSLARELCLVSSVYFLLISYQILREVQGKLKIRLTLHN